MWLGDSFLSFRIPVVILQYSQQMGFRFAKWMLGLMVMGLAFSTMAPANAVTPGQVCVRTPSGIAFSTTVQWEYNDNYSREIATDSNGCANFPHLPQAYISITTSRWIMQRGPVILSVGNRETSNRENIQVEVDSSGLVILESGTNPPDVKYTSMTFRTNKNKPVTPPAFEITSFHDNKENNYGYSFTQAVKYGDYAGEETWQLSKECDGDTYYEGCGAPTWIDKSGVLHFYYLGALAQDPRERTRYDPDTDLTVTEPENPKNPRVTFTGMDSVSGIKKHTYELAETNQVIRLVKFVSLTKIPKKPVKYKFGKSIKLTFKLLDSKGKPWKNQWVTGETYPGLVGGSCLRPKAKSNARGLVTLTFCPVDSQPFYLSIKKGKKYYEIGSFETIQTD
jgi:hypothetical protein